MRRVLPLVSILFCIIFTPQLKAGEHYWLVDTGIASINKSESPGPAFLVGLSYGYGFNKNWAMEFNYNQTVAGGSYSNDLQFPVNTKNTEKGKYQLQLFSSNAVYHHLITDNLYLKGKLGFTFGEEKRTSDIGNGKTSSVNAINGAIGGGYLAGPVIGSSLTVEMELAMLKQDTFALMLGANATF